MDGCLPLVVVIVLWLLQPVDLFRRYPTRDPCCRPIPTPRYGFTTVTPRLAFPVVHLFIVGIYCYIIVVVLLLLPCYLFLVFPVTLLKA